MTNRLEESCVSYERSKVDGQLNSLTFFVPGEPRPQPKSNPRFGTSGYIGSYHRDPKGRMKAWKQLVVMYAIEAVAQSGVFQPDVALRLGVATWETKAKSNKKKYPTQRPDWSNYRYFIENILQKIAYGDDCMIIGPLPGDKHWADADHSPGALVTLERVDKDGRS